MTDIFISSAYEDRAWVASLAAAFERAGLTVWWEADAALGKNVDAEIEAALGAARTVVVVWSAAALAARPVRAVTADAMERRVLHAVLKERVTPPLAFRALAATDLTAWTGGPDEGLDHLIRRLRPGAPALDSDDLTHVTSPAADRPDDERTMFSPRALRAGEIVAHYRIVGPLGEGGSGKIFEARNIHNEDERVALKILQPGMADRSQFLAFLRAEANALQRVKNEAVVQYRTFGRIPDSDEFFLVIEFVEGPTLAKAMRSRRFTADELRRLAVRIADGLGAAHDQNVIHRDLSPDNVVLPGGDPTRATLIDFGIARIGASDQLGTAFAGKLSYAAPEQFEGDPALIGPWTDLYSLGLLLAAAARGRKLDMGSDIASAIARRRRVPDLEGVPDSLHGPIAALLQPLPAARVRTAADAALLFDGTITPAATVLTASPPVQTPPAAAKSLISIRDPEPPPPKPAPSLTADGKPMIVIRDAPVAAVSSDGPRPGRRWLWLGAAGVLLAGSAVAAILLLGGPAAPPSDPLPPVVELDPEPVPPEPTPPEPTPPDPLPPTPDPVPPEPTPPEGETPTGDALLDPTVAAAVARAREAATLARAAEARGDAAAAAARTVETAARAKAEEAANAATIACTAGADSQHYFCGVPNGRPELFYRGQIAAGGRTVYEGLGVLEDTRANTRHRGVFAAGEPVGAGERTRLDPEGPPTAFDDCAGIWGTGGLQPQGVCLWRATPGATRITIAGGYQDSKSAGPGMAVFVDEGHFSGDFAAGMMSGHGVYVALDGARAELAYRDNKPVAGLVTLTRNGATAGRYEGELGPEPSTPNGLPFTFEGLGALYAANGAILAQGRWRDGRLVEALGAQGEGGGLAAQPLPALPVSVPDPRLTAALAKAADAVAKAATEATRADKAAQAAIDIAAAAEKPTADGELAAVKARAAAKKACAQTPAPQGFGCFATDSGGHYAGEAKCTKNGICTSRGYGVLKFEDGWAFAGFWGKTSIDLGCELENDVVRYCGEENDPGVDSLGRFTRNDGLIGIGRMNANADNFVGTYDFSAMANTATKTINGTATKGKVEGPGWMQGRDGSLYRGSFAASKRAGFAKATTAAGARIAAFYARGVPSSGEVLYADDRRYVGEMSGGSGFEAIPNGLGVLYSPSGRIEAQGRWQDGKLAEAFGATGALAADSRLTLPVGDGAPGETLPDLTLDRAPKAGR